MNLENLKITIPKIENWITSYVEENKEKRVRLDSTKFENLKTCFETATLEKSFYAVVDKIKTPPLSQMGLPYFSEFEEGGFAGITYKDTYFITKENQRLEKLHFHEMVHIVQWDELGPHNFILRYSLCLSKYGYKKSPLEEIAYNLENKSKNNEIIPNCEKIIREHARSTFEKHYHK